MVRRHVKSVLRLLDVLFAASVWGTIFIKYMGTHNNTYNTLLKHKTAGGSTLEYSIEHYSGNTQEIIFNLLHEGLALPLSQVVQATTETPDKNMSYLVIGLAMIKYTLKPLSPVPSVHNHCSPCF